ncbi:MAG: hypothetical protein PHY56_01055 [Candidatus Omnitrophica bacterium]|jgi:hypothetical protein|nr:hypothetical protein [Candidatus Omnitrophota bacterium]
MKCCLCKKEIPIEANGWAEGNNAEPLRKGRCCNECNLAIVIPARLAGMLRRKGGIDESI